MQTPEKLKNIIDPDHVNQYSTRKESANEQEASYDDDGLQDTNSHVFTESMSSTDEHKLDEATTKILAKLS